MERRIIPTSRECQARLVPTGEPITVGAGTFVTLTQALGGAFTIIVNGNMARIDGEDADVLGLTPMTPEFASAPDGTVLEENVRIALRSVYDPEIPVNILDLGLVYAIRIEQQHVHIDMTLTAPGCGMGPVLVQEVERRVALVPNVTAVTVDLVFDPPWSRDRMTEEAQLELGLF